MVRQLRTGTVEIGWTLGDLVFDPEPGQPSPWDDKSIVVLELSCGCEARIVVPADTTLRQAVGIAYAQGIPGSPCWRHEDSLCDSLSWEPVS